MKDVLSDPKTADLATIARELAPLTGSGVWIALKKHFEGYREGAVQAIARRLMAGEKLTDEKIAFVRGYATAIEDIFTTPEVVAKQLDKAALRAYERAAEEQFSLEEEPYG